MTARHLVATLTVLLLFSLCPVASLAAGAAEEAEARLLALAGAEVRIALVAPEAQAQGLQFEVSAKSSGAVPVDWRAARLELADGTSLAPDAVAFPGAVTPDGWTNGTLSFVAPRPGITGRVTLTIPTGVPGAAAARFSWDLPDGDGTPAGPT
ncbi:MAG: hypothetical protein ACM3RP_10675 [Chitinophagales bacterium]